ncbi:unnamed protein product, partial [Coregonus sp. 'balchen']
HVSDHKGGWDKPSESTAEGELGGWDKPSESTAEGELGGWDKPSESTAEGELGGWDKPSESTAEGELGGWDKPSESTAEGELGGWDKPSESTAEGELGDQTKAVPTVTSPVGQGLEVMGNLNAQIPSLLSMPTRNHMDITTPPLPTVAPEVLRVAEHRHKKGLMYPYIYHILTKGEIKLSVTIEDEANHELPSAVQLFRPIRQYVYGVLFSLAEAKKKADRLAMRRNRLPEYPPVVVKEWAAYKGKSPHTPELVEALPFREWTCPNLKKLWLGKSVEEKNGRMRAFLACMRSDSPAMLNPACVPTQLLVLCCVLRFMLQWPGVRVLRGKELDAFLSQALSPKLYEPEQLQELKLAALFMSGVDMALLANDVCGQPIPWEHCCPWMYFDGKLLQSKLIRAIRDKAPLIDLCDGGAFYPPPHMMPLQGRSRGMGMGMPGLPSMSSQGGKLEIAGTVVGQWAGIRRGRGRGGFPIQQMIRAIRDKAPLIDLCDGLPSMSSQGGKLEIAGTVVGQRLRGVISTPVIRTFGRGAKYPLRGFKSQGTYQVGQGTYQVGQGTYQSKPAYSLASEVKERKKLKTEEKEKSPVLLSSDGSTTENGLEEREEEGVEEREEEGVEEREEEGVEEREEEGVEERELEQLKGQAAEERESRAPNIQPESAFSSDSKMCNTNPHLNALNTGSACLRDAAEPLSAADSVLQTEEGSEEVVVTLVRGGGGHSGQRRWWSLWSEEVVVTLVRGGGGHSGQRRRWSLWSEEVVVTLVRGGGGHSGQRRRWSLWSEEVVVTLVRGGGGSHSGQRRRWSLWSEEEVVTLVRGGGGHSGQRRWWWSLWSEEEVVTLVRGGGGHSGQRRRWSLWSEEEVVTLVSMSKGRQAVPCHQGVPRRLYWGSEMKFDLPSEYSPLLITSEAMKKPSH